MAEPHITKRIRFPQPKDKIIDIHGVGYDDLRSLKPYKAFQPKNNYSLHYVRNGKGFLHIYGKQYNVSAGDFFLIPAGESAMYYPDDAEPWRYYFFSIYDSCGKELTEAIGFSDQIPVVHASNPQKITELIDMLFESENSSTELYYKTLTVLLMIASSVYPSDQLQTQFEKQPSLADEITQIIDENFTNCTFFVSEIPQMLHISHSHMCRTFKKATGISPLTYLNELRLRHSINLMKNKAFTIKDLSSAVGFSNEQYFMKLFKKKYGMTVGAYRKMLRDTTNA